MFEKTTKKIKKTNNKESALEMKRLLINAIRMHALYSNGKIRIFETSNVIN